jgi:hypothetical protein
MDERSVYLILSFSTPHNVLADAMIILFDAKRVVPDREFPELTFGIAHRPRYPGLIGTPAIAVLAREPTYRTRRGTMACSA